MKFRSILHVSCAAACLAGVAQLQAQVPPPPLPIGSALARPDPGLSKPERGRAVRAHHHKLQHKKDYTRDDSLDGPPAATPAATGPAGKPADPGPGASSSGKNPK